jgi:hypothetical protein
MTVRLLLALLAKHPRLAVQIKSLAEAQPLMFATELKKEFSSFLAAVYPLMSSEEQGALEDRILAMGEQGTGNERPC